MSILSNFDPEKETCETVSSDLNYSGGKPRSDSGLDFWLKHHLAQLYGPVVDDPISDDLLKRLEAALG